ncbi:acetylxylan esterase [Pedobacter yonginense]|uniref:Acetylxylan esterase n=1 Tax=Pedobacter yonginense TaxID=651869 RepID=A0A317EK26_9SPHI|nr:sialate O-acetylesterase [Pedobacter yonginense]PWS26213.1 acetylxylan esterase [Pedobacter yonginense]
MVHSFLMIGQSNMAGRGFLEDVDPIFDEHIKMLRNGRWQTMVEPINYDRPTAGIGLAASFATAWRLKNGSDEIGLIPCADGGTSLDDWGIQGELFENAIMQVELARRNSVLKGVLWHQGENDSAPENAGCYLEKFSLIVKSIRNRLDAPNLPFILGGLGDFLTKGVYGSYFSAFPIVNKSLRDFADADPDCYFVPASGLTANPDLIHFDAKSQRRFGIRYFEAYDELRNARHNNIRE